ncbi:MAG: nucleotide excision repair endonuclease, partial [bacterium]
MKSQYIKKLHLPDNPGVYIFKDKAGRPLYIGRATSLKDRVKSYFGSDLIETRGPILVDMVIKAVNLSFIKTDSVLEAIILESNEIKKHL